MSALETVTTGSLVLSARVTGTTGSLLLDTPVAFATGAVSFVGAVGRVRRHSATVMRLSDGLVLIIGALPATGLWDDGTIGMQSWASGFGGFQ